MEFKVEILLKSTLSTELESMTEYKDFYNFILIFAFMWLKHFSHHSAWKECIKEFHKGTDCMLMMYIYIHNC